MNHSCISGIARANVQLRASKLTYLHQELHVQTEEMSGKNTANINLDGKKRAADDLPCVQVTSLPRFHKNWIFLLPFVTDE